MTGGTPCLNGTFSNSEAIVMTASTNNEPGLITWI